MGSLSLKEEEEEVEEAGAISSTLKLPLLSIQLPVSRREYSPEHSGMITPPLHASVSVPFRWEEEPGKPRPCTALISTTHLSHLQDPHATSITDTPTKCLELPPRLQSFTDPKIIMSHSPTTVLDGPYLPLFHSSSFRFASRRRDQRQGSFGSSCESPERPQFGSNSSTLNSTVLRINKSGSSSSTTTTFTFFDEGKGRSSGGLLFGSWRKKSSHTHRRGKSEVGGGSFVAFSPSSVDLGAGFGVDNLETGGPAAAGGAKKVSRIARNGSSFSSLSQVRSHFWATIYKGFKQVLPRKSTNAKKDGLLV